MALNAYLTITGQKSGQVKGSVTDKDNADAILVVAVDYSLTSPRDPASGLPTGKTVHAPLIITKELDKSSPVLYNMLTTNETITQFVLKFFTAQAPTPVGATAIDPAQNFTITLTNASVSNVDFSTANTLSVDSQALEEISFTYEKIEWTWNDGGITAADDWEAPAA